MPRPGQGLTPAALAAASGLLVSLCLPRPGVPFICWVALAPLFLSMRGATVRQGFLRGWAAGFSFHGLTLYWIYDTCRFAGTPIWVAVLAWSAMSLFLGVHWGLIGAAGAWSAEALPRALRPWGWAVLWTAAFGVATAWGPRLCSDLLEYTAFRHFAIIQCASVFGPHGVGFLIVLVGATLAEAWEAQEDESVRINAALCFALLLAAGGWGSWQLEKRAEFKPAATARVEILQPNVDQYQKWDPQLADRIAAGFDELLALPAAGAPHLIVWPESAIPHWVDEGRSVDEPALWSKKLGVFQIVGVVERGPSGEHNAAALIGPDGSLRGTYLKRELVPFGEYVPFPVLRRYIGILNQMGDLTAGAPRQTLLKTPLGLAGVTICYEAMFPRWARLDASRGARLIVNVTNDGWYKDTWGPYQHFGSNFYRAIENRVAVIRSGNTGISATIDPWGVITSRLDLNKRGRLDAEVPLDDAFPQRSFYARHGDWFAALCGLLALALFCAAPALRYRA